MPPSETQVKAPGLFNWRLKWRCRFPTDGVEFLLRLGVWDENTLSPNQAILVRSLFAVQLLPLFCWYGLLQCILARDNQEPALIERELHAFGRTWPLLFLVYLSLIAGHSVLI